MCVSPIYINNPLYSKEGIYSSYVREIYGDKILSKICIPCGVCPDCIQMKQSDIVQRVQMELRDNFCYMVTLTYNNDSVPWLDFSTGERHMICDFNDIRLMIKRLRKFYPDIFDDKFKYIFVSEYGGKRHRPHYHGLLFFTKDNRDKLDSLSLESKLWLIVKNEWRRNYGTRFIPDYKPCFTYKRFHGYRNYDLHQILYDRGSDISSVGYYITKYLLKYDYYIENMVRYYHETLELEEFYDKIHLFKPRRSCSHGFGLNDYSKDYIRFCIDKSFELMKPYPIYINPDNGTIQPLGRYFRKKFITMEDMVRFSQMPGFDDYIDRTRDILEINYKSSRYDARVKKILQNSADYDDF